MNPVVEVSMELYEGFAVCSLIIIACIIMIILFFDLDN